MSVPVPLGNRNTNNVSAAHSPMLISIGKLPKLIHKKSPNSRVRSGPTQTSLHENSNEPVNSISQRHVRSALGPAASQHKENRAPSCGAPSNNVSPSRPRRPALAQYQDPSDLIQFVQALRDNPDAAMVGTMSGTYALFPADQAPEDWTLGGLPAPVRLLRDLSNQATATLSYSDERRIYALPFLVDFEQAVRRNPRQALRMLVNALDCVGADRATLRECQRHDFL